MPDLVEYSRTSFGAGTAAALTSYFNRVALPVPRAGEFTITWENGFLVFLNHAACVLRIIPRDMVPDAALPGLLRPLGSYDADRLRADMYPGVACPVSEKDATALSDFLQKWGFNFWDRKTQNCGYLPSAGEMARLPVVIDPCAVKKLEDSLNLLQLSLTARRFVKDWFNPGDTTVFDGIADPGAIDARQEKLYGPLRRAFSDVMSGGAPQKFWDACVTMKKSGILVPGWMENKSVQKNNYKNARDGSQKYAEHIERVRPHDTPNTNLAI